MNWWKTQFLFTFVVACCTVCRYLFQNLKLTYVIYYKMNLREKRLKILALKVLKATKGEISESFSCMVQKSKWRLTFCLTPWTNTELPIQYITTWLTLQTCNVSNDSCSSKCSSFFCEYFINPLANRRLVRRQIMF